LIGSMTNVYALSIFVECLNGFLKVKEITYRKGKNNENVVRGKKTLR